jgi:methylated-DNA-[protein]-cysteine S-methyltransferase
MMDANRRHAIVTTPIGDLTLVASGDALIGVYFPKHWTKPNARTFGERVEASSDPLLSLAEQQLDDYVQGARTAFDLPTQTRGDAFQERIWTLIREIPYGETATYGELALNYGDRSLARDVGQAVGSNPLSVIVPCHRVVGKDGKLVGYAGGLERKQALLELEGAVDRRDDARQLTLGGIPSFAGRQQ